MNRYPLPPINALTQAFADVPEHLLTVGDLDTPYWARAGQWATAANQLRERLERLDYQAVWLGVEDIFQKTPQLARITFKVEDEVNAPFFYLEAAFTNTTGRTFSTVETDALNDWLIQLGCDSVCHEALREFFDALAKTPITRENLPKTGERVLGPAWAAQRQALVLSQECPEPTRTAKRPRV